MPLWAKAMGGHALQHNVLAYHYDTVAFLTLSAFQNYIGSRLYLSLQTLP